jgi:hypothetical protein
MKIHEKNCWPVLLNGLLLLMPLSVLQGSLYKNRRAYFLSNTLTAGLCVGLGLIVYKASGPILRRLIPDDASAPSQLLLRGMSAATVSLAAGALTGKAITQSLYMSFSNQSLLPELVKQTLDKLDVYIMYLSSIEAVEKQLDKVIDNLDAEKYHQNGLPERLVCLDGAYYHLKEHDLITELKNECNYHRSSIQAQLNSVQFYIENTTPAAERLKKLSDRYKKVMSHEHPEAHTKAFKYVQAHNKITLFNKLNELDIHIKLFMKGFNQGINIIDEASKVNLLARRLVEIIGEQLSAHYESIKILLAECQRIKKLEKTVKAYTKRKLTVS